MVGAGGCIISPQTRLESQPKPVYWIAVAGKTFVLQALTLCPIFQMFGVKGISEGIQVSGKQYTAMFDVWRKTDVEIMFRAFHV